MEGYTVNREYPNVGVSGSSGTVTGTMVGLNSQNSNFSSNEFKSNLLGIDITASLHSFDLSKLHMYDLREVEKGIRSGVIKVNSDTNNMFSHITGVYN